MTSARVLAVEDDAVQELLFRAWLTGAGIEFRNCADPAQFLDEVHAFEPDLVIMDVVLPGAFGYDLARSLRAARPDDLIPVIFTTVHADESTRVETARAGGDGFLLKPLAPSVLIATIKAQIERWHALRNRLDCDSLTGLLSHSAFFRRVRRAIACRNEPMTLIALDLDDFKAVNDLFGHAAGDDHLRELADVLRMHWPDATAIGRVGGDELAILVSGGAAEAAEWIEVMKVRAVKQFEERGLLSDPRFTAGVVQLREGMDAREWREAADAAMYAAKRRRTYRLLRTG